MDCADAGSSKGGQFHATSVFSSSDAINPTNETDLALIGKKSLQLQGKQQQQQQRHHQMMATRMTGNEYTGKFEATAAADVETIEKALKRSAPSRKTGKRATK